MQLVLHRRASAWLLATLVTVLSSQTPGFAPRRPQTEADCGPLNRVGFGWLNPTLRLGSTRPLQQADLPALRSDDAARLSADKLEEEYTGLVAVGADSPRTVARALWRAFGAEFAGAGALKLASDICQIANPILLKRIVSMLERGVGLQSGLGVAGILFVANAVQTVCLRHYFAQTFRTGLRLRAALIGVTYRKLLRLSPAAQIAASTGEVTNLVGADAQRVADLTPYLHALWFAPLQVCAALVLLYREIGISLLPGLALIGAMLAANKRIAAATFRCQQALLRTRDERGRLMRELISGMKAIKLQAWEPSFERRVNAVRDVEVHGMRRLIWLRSFLGSVFACTPSLVAVAMLTMHTLRGNKLELRTALTVVATVNLLRAPLVFLPLVLQSMQEADLSLQRLQRFLGADEHTPVGTGGLPGVGLEIRGADFSWQSSPPPATEGGGQRAGFSLRDINLQARPGEMIALMGSVGSGKSSLIAALLGDLAPRHGAVSMRGSVAYTSQTPFLVSGSLRDNICFGQPYDEDRYAEVVHACALEPDIASLPAGDLTPLGARGLGLSGGQRARVSLARAVYADAQVYLLDDPLAAVDSEVASWLIDKVLGPKGLLGRKVRVLATNSLDAARAAHQVVVLRNGEAHEQGSFAQLEARNNGELQRLIRAQSQTRGPVEAGSEAPSDPPLDQLPEPASEPPSLDAADSSAASESALAAQPASADGAPPFDALPDDPSIVPTDVVPGVPPDSLGATSAWPASPAAVQSDAVDSMTGQAEAVSAAQADGAVEAFGTEGGAKEGASPSAAETNGGTDYERQVGSVQTHVYLGWVRAAGGLAPVLLGLVPLLGAELLSISQSWWLTQWSKAASPRTAMRLSVYAALAVGAAALTVLRSVVVLGLGMRAGCSLHDTLLRTVVRASMGFFDVTPLGALLNRFGRDLQTAEVALPAAMQSYGATLVSVLSSMLVVCTAAPAMLAALAPVGLLCVALQRFYMASSREIKRLEATTRAPLLSHVGETLDGIGTIRAMDAGRRFEAECCARLDDNVQATLLNCLANCWLGLRLELLGAAVAALFAALAFARTDARFAAVPGLGAGGGVGAAALGLTLALQATQSLNWAVRQACELEGHMVSVERLKAYDALPPEAAYDYPQQPPPEPRLPESAGWAAAPSGGLELRGVSLRYRDGLPLVLQGITASIKPTEKVGVVGRTGSGKSSLLAALTALVAPPQRSGAIELDGVEIASRNLLQHRAGVAVIPQEPVLFSGTIASNLDPERRYTDEQLWTALQRVQMAHAVRSLDDPVAEGGLNLSAGQRQLLCIARALLSRCSLVILDEATSSVDAETDAIIQRTVRSEFSDATVITVAHRLSSVLDADKIMVLEQGRLVEFGAPKELMARSGGRFRALVHAQPAE